MSFFASDITNDIRFQKSQIFHSVHSQNDPHFSVVFGFYDIVIVGRSGPHYTFLHFDWLKKSIKYDPDWPTGTMSKDPKPPKKKRVQTDKH